MKNSSELVVVKNLHLDAFLERHPTIETVELVVTDPGGIARGKWAPVSALKKAFDDGVNFPLSLHGLDVWGNEVEETGLHISSGDMDGFYKAVETSLSAVPWGGTNHNASEPTCAQVLLQTHTETDEPFSACSRQVLGKVLQQFEEQNLTPVVAFELEFHLLKPKSEWQNDQPEVATLPDTSDAQFMYGLDALAENARLFADIRQAALWADIPLDTIVKEAAPGQFEINLNHRADALRAADDVVLLKRIVRECARSHGMIATFMAKPFPDQPGNGMHVHCSALDENNRNIFSDEDGKTLLHSASAGLIETMRESTLIFINTKNGFRRMASGSYAPTRTSWGENNRSVAVRLPAAPDQARRIEHRVSGADANPYLVVAQILSAMMEGMNKRIAPPPMLVGNGYDESTPNRGTPLPADLQTAIELFRQSEFCQNTLGELMHKVIGDLKQAELDGFLAEMTSLEKATYL